MSNIFYKNHPYFHKTKIPCPDLDPILLFNIYESLKFSSSRQHQEDIKNPFLWKNEEIYYKLKKIDLLPVKLRFFRWPAKKKCFPWHIDGKPKTPSSISINWIISGGGIVQWSTDVQMLENHEAVYSQSENSSEKDNYIAVTDGNACLLNTAIPHRVVNTDNNSRFSLTLQFLPGKTDFLKAVELLHSVDLLY